MPTLRLSLSSDSESPPTSNDKSGGILTDVAELVLEADGDKTKRSFGAQIGVSNIKIERLAKENFDLKLHNKMLHEQLDKTLKGLSEDKRYSVDISFYPDDESSSTRDSLGNMNAKTKYLSDVHEICARYEQESTALAAKVKELQAKLIQSEERAAAVLRKKDAEISEREEELLALLGEKDAELAEKEEKASALLRQKDAELAERAEKVSVLLGEKDAEMASVQSEESTLRVQVTELSSHLEAERNARMDLGEQLRCSQRATRRVVAEQSARIRELEVQLESESSLRTLQRQATAHLYDELPAGLSEPGFKLYQLLRSRMKKRDMGEDGFQGGEFWRETVLKETDTALLKLYSMARRLEQERTTFVDKYCRPLIARQTKYSS